MYARVCVCMATIRPGSVSRSARHVREARAIDRRIKELRGGEREREISFAG